jgi:hypothetical protein
LTVPQEVWTRITDPTADPTKAKIITTGNAEALSDFRSGADIAMWVNPVVAPIMFAQTYSDVKAQVVKLGASLESLNIRIEEGHLHIAGKASKTGGSSTFSMNAVPRLDFRPAHCEGWNDKDGKYVYKCTPDTTQLWFQMDDVQVDIKRDWWIYLLEIFGDTLTFGIGSMVVQDFINNINWQVNNAVRGQNISLSDTGQYLSLPGTTEPMINLLMKNFDCHADGLFTRYLFIPEYPKAAIHGPNWMRIERTLQVQGPHPLSYHVTLPFEVHPEDSNVRIRWTLIDGNKILSNVDDIVKNHMDFSVELLPTSIPPIGIRDYDYSIQCRVYRTLGAEITDLFNGYELLVLNDCFDRGHPYVRWRHTIYPPRWVVWPSGYRFKIADKHQVDRVSCIHRTAVPGRCIMACDYSEYSLIKGAGTFEYLDELPFPVSELAAYRGKHVICDYCFFGGPTKTDPLI